LFQTYAVIKTEILLP